MKKLAVVCLVCSLVVSPVQGYFNFDFLQPNHRVRKILRTVVGVGLAAYCTEEGFEATRLLKGYVAGRSRNSEVLWDGFVCIAKVLITAVFAKQMFDSASGR